MTKYLFFCKVLLLEKILILKKKIKLVIQGVHKYKTNENSLNFKFNNKNKIVGIGKHMRTANELNK